jgi:hypothetical protein
MHPHDNPFDCRWFDVEQALTEHEQALAEALQELRTSTLKGVGFWLFSSTNRYVDWVMTRRKVSRATAEGSYLQGARWLVEMLREEMAEGYAKAKK